MSVRTDGTKVRHLKIVTENDTEHVESPPMLDPLTDHLRRFTAQVTALLADVEIQLEATIARELCGVGEREDGEEDELRRLRPRRFSRAA